MAEVKFTKGPWIFDPWSSDKGEALYCVYAPADRTRDYTPIVLPRDNTPSLHDALLIAAAPELFAACVSALRLFGSLDDFNEVTCHEVETEIRLAIKKATGG